MSTLFPIARHLDTIGDGTGQKNANGNYSVSPQTFKYIIPEGKGAELSTIAIHISASSNFALSSYGNIAGGLNNGMTIQLGLNGNEYQMLDHPIKNNDDLFHLSPSMNHINFAGGGDSICIPITADQFGFKLSLSGGDYIQFTLNDDFSGLSSHHIQIYGFSN